MGEIKTVEEAIEFLIEKAGISTERVDYKYRVFDEDFKFDEDFNVFIRTDKELIEYANEQKKVLKDC